VSDVPKPPVGSIGWCDLTVPEAGTVRDFYRDVVGWTATEIDMGGYSDFVMNHPGDGTPSTGVCWARGVNADLPPVWLVYFIVASLDASVAQVRARGGAVLRGPTSSGGGMVAVVRDPAGAVCALYESGS
jgi:predicted enzyme related to lactoylglutathione lyase